MAIEIWKRIEYIRQQPESVRMRYLLGCLVVSMLFILSIWLLSLRESFGIISSEVPAAPQSIPEALSGGSGQSLNDLVEGQTPLRVEENQNSGENSFFETQLNERSSTPGN